MSKRILTFRLVIVTIGGMVDSVSSFLTPGEQLEHFNKIVRRYCPNISDAKLAYCSNRGYYRGEADVCMENIHLSREAVAKELFREVRRECLDTEYVLDLITGVNNDCERRDPHG